MNRLPKPEELTRDWYVVDAGDEVLGRLASEVAKIIQGKHRPYYSPQWDMGDHVIITNARKINVTGKKETDKIYYRHTGYPGGIREENVAQVREDKPEELIFRAVKGMLPKNRLARKMIEKLHVYADAEHPHEAQQPKPLRKDG